MQHAACWRRSGWGRGTCVASYQHIYIYRLCGVLRMCGYITISMPIYVVSTSTASIECSCNYISKVLFTSPSWYLFTISIGHILICRWAVPPLFAFKSKRLWLAQWMRYMCASSNGGPITFNCNYYKHDVPMAVLMKRVHDTQPIAAWFRRRHPSCSFAMTEDVLFSSFSSAQWYA